MSYASAVEPLRAANLISGRRLYSWSHLTVDAGPVEASVGPRIAPDLSLEAAGGLDALFVCAGGNPAAFDHKPTFARLRALAAGGVPIGGMSGGAYILARAGLLRAPALYDPLGAHPGSDRRVSRSLARAHALCFQTATA